jgi:hypothetical protein
LIDKLIRLWSKAAGLHTALAHTTQREHTARWVLVGGTFDVWKGFWDRGDCRKERVLTVGSWFRMIGSWGRDISKVGKQKAARIGTTQVGTSIDPEPQPQKNEVSILTSLA